jgi:glutathione S-transferase
VRVPRRGCPRRDVTRADDPTQDSDGCDLSSAGPFPNTSERRKAHAKALPKEALPVALERLDRELVGREFFAGAFSLVDCELIPFAAGLSDIDMEIPTQYPNLRGWLDRVRARPSYRTAEVDSRFTAVLLRETAAAGQRSA